MLFWCILILFTLLLEEMEVLSDNFKNIKKKNWKDLHYRLKVSFMSIFAVFRSKYKCK